MCRFTPIKDKEKSSYSLFVLGSLSLQPYSVAIGKEISVDQNLVEFKNPEIP